jgi:hypothetical protein
LQQSSEPLLCSREITNKKEWKAAAAWQQLLLLQCRKFLTRAVLQIIAMTMQLSSFIKCCSSTTAAATYTSVLLFVVGCCFTATLLPGSSAAVATNTSTTPEVMINLQSGLEIIRKILWSI